MKYLNIILLTLPLILSAETLVNKEGKKINAENLSYDGNLIKATINGRTMEFSPDILDESNWESINYERTKDMGVSLRVRQQTERTSGNITTKEFKVEVSLTSHFSKKVKVIYHWLGGYTEEEVATVSFNNRYDKTLVPKIKVERKPEGMTQTLVTPLGNESSIAGEKIDLMVVVKDMEGKVIAKEFYNTEGKKEFEKRYGN